MTPSRPMLGSTDGAALQSDPTASEPTPVHRQTCVIGGWMDPRGSRPFFGALLLGIYDAAGALKYVGHTGAGFTDAELGRIWKRLHALQTKTCPFSRVPRTSGRPHWVRPKIVVEVRFTEWTADGKLRHPTYLQLRDDLRPQNARKEGGPMPSITVKERATPRTGARAGKTPLVTKAVVERLLAQLDDIQERGGSGRLDLPGGHALEVTNLGKVFWPSESRSGHPSPKRSTGRGSSRGTDALTKGDLFRHYVRVAPVLLPVLADRPLVMKRFPNGIAGQPFYQHRSEGNVPPGVRVETAATETEKRPHVIGGDLISLLYTVQLASISQDPWFSRVGSEEFADHVAIDLDPPDDLPFGRVLDVAQWVRDELDLLGAKGFAKTSGAGGLHIYVPMPDETRFDAGLLFCQIVATMVARKHPKHATVERSIKARGERVYVDYLQNIRGKTLASAYSARANAFAGVSTPLTWEEVADGVSPQDFTMRNFAARLADAGDLWAALRKSKAANLRAVSRYAETGESDNGRARTR